MDKIRKIWKRKPVTYWVVLAFVLLFILGLWLDFSPSPFWEGKSGYISFFVALSIWVLILYLIFTRQIKLADPTIVFPFVFVGIFVIWMLMYQLVLRAVPSFITMMVGNEFKKIVQVEKVYQSRRRSCDYYVSNKELERIFSDGLCVSQRVYEELEHKAQFVLIGKVTVFGRYIEKYYPAKKQ